MMRTKEIKAWQSGISKMIEVPKPEQPLLSFNKLCFGLMNNDYLLAITAGVKFLTSLIFFAYMYNRSI